MSKSHGGQTLPTRPSSLVVLSTGMWGAVWNVEFMRERLQEAGGRSVLVHAAACNAMLKSYSGIDVCGLRLVAEVRSLLDEREDLSDVRSVSFIGYSAGGLFVRYAIGVLYEEGFFSARGITLDKVISMATPHLGVRSSTQSFLGRVRNGLISTLGNAYGGASLEQMTLTDKRPEGMPLLLHMAQPGTRYHDALGSCQEVYFYANALNDNTVSYCSAALARRNPFGTMKDIPRLEAYPVISGLQRVCDDADLRVGFDHGQRPNNGRSDSPGGPVPVSSRDGAAGADGNGQTSNVSLIQQDIPTTSEGERLSGVALAYTEDRKAGEGVQGNGKGGTLSEVRTAAIAVVLAPLLVAHFFVLIVPLRIAHAATVVDEADVRRQASATPDFQPANATGCPSGDCEQNAELAEPLDEEAGRREAGGDQTTPDGNLVALHSQSSVHERRPIETRAATSAGGLPVTAAFSGVEGVAGVRKASGVVLDGGVSGVPAAIRRLLGRPELGIQRVNVCLSGPHTHGTIVVRRSYVNKAGKVVIDHVASLLFPSSA